MDEPEISIESTEQGLLIDFSGKFNPVKFKDQLSKLTPGELNDLLSALVQSHYSITEMGKIVLRESMQRAALMSMPTQGSH